MWQGSYIYMDLKGEGRRECLSSAAQYFTAQRINDADYRGKYFLRLSCTNLKASSTTGLLSSSLLRSRGYESLTACLPACKIVLPLKHHVNPFRRICLIYYIMFFSYCKVFFSFLYPSVGFLIVLAYCLQTKTTVS